MMKRFITSICILSWLLVCSVGVFSQDNFNKELLITSLDSVKINQTLNQFKDLQNLPIGKLMTEIGKSFQKTPYVAETLETGDEEIMVINLRQFDCTTFAENCLAFARCIKQDKTSITYFIEELKNIRYRDGELDGYCSRLHYFSEWIADNEQKGLVTQPKNVMNVELPIRVNFMSKHPDNYPALHENPKLIPFVEEIEDTISSHNFFYLPKSQIAKNENLLEEGDIIGITTNITGLDIAHVGMVTFKNDRAHLLHASYSLKKVVVSEKTLADYLLPKKSFTGIMIARPIE